MARVLLDTELWKLDPKAIRLPWRGDEQADIHERAATSGLCFGVMGWDGIVMPHPPIQRAIVGTVEKLKARGHEVSRDGGLVVKHNELISTSQVIDWAPPPHSEAFEILVSQSTICSGSLSPSSALVVFSPEG